MSFKLFEMPAGILPSSLLLSKSNSRRFVSGDISGRVPARRLLWSERRVSAVMALSVVGNDDSSRFTCRFSEVSRVNLPICEGKLLVMLFSCNDK